MSDEKESATMQVLELIGLAHDEVNTYFKITGRGPVMIGEIALLAEVEEERAAEIAENLFHKGLIRQIPGNAPIYEALPPYAALLGQIHQFKETIKTFQEVTPKNIQERFDSLETHSTKLKKLDDYRAYIQVMKTKLPEQIKSQFDRFEKELEQVNRFRDVRRFILNLKEIVPAEVTKEFGLMEGRLETMKTEISNRFEKQFRIGALKSMAEKIVSRVISEQFKDITVLFRDKFVQTTQNMLDQVVEQLGNITDTAGEISSDLGTVFSDIESGIKTTLEDLESRVSDVYDDIITGIKELKDLFRTEIFETIQNDMKLIFPMHPRTRNNIKGTELGKRVEAMKNLILLEPVGYLDFLCLMSNAALVMTDSGGIQEETTFLGVPCMTLRKNTERPVTITEGTNRLVHITTKDILKNYHELKVSVFDAKEAIPKFWDGKAADRIVEIIAN